MTKHHQLSFLHISDVHFGCKDDVGIQERVLDALEKVLTNSGTKIDCVIFTGDLAQKGVYTEFLQGQEWLSAICKMVNAPCILVPGNHDMNRKEANTQVLRSAYSDLDAFGRWNDKIFSSEHAHVRPFLEWFKQAKIDNPQFLNTWDTNPTMDRVSVTLSDISCVFVCLNTAILSCDDKDEGKLCVDLKGLNGSLKNRLTENNLVVAVGHHPSNFLAAWNKTAFETTLGQATGPHIYLHGHLHDLKHAVSYTNTGAGFFNGAAGAAYPGDEYTKQFSFVHIELQDDSPAGQINSEVFEYSDESGEWIKNNARSNPVPARLPTIASCKRDPLDLIETPTPALQTWKNPFSHVMANGMPPESIHRLFVERSNSLSNLKNRVDSIVEGQRGTGKTMLLRYFSMEVQSSLLQNEDSAADIIDLINKTETPFGIYCCLTKAGLNRSDLGAIENKARRETLFIHITTLFVISKLMSALNVLCNSSQSTKILPDDLCTFISRLLRLPSTTKQPVSTKFPLRVVSEINLLLIEANEHIASLLPGCTATLFNPWLSLSSGLMPLLELIRSELDLQVPFFLLIDDFDQLNAEQQSLIFNSAAARQHDIICYKFGIMSEGQKTFLASDGRTYREGDDYNFVRLDWVDGGLSTDNQSSPYVKTVEEISARRMALVDWPNTVNLSNLLDNWESGNRVRDEAKIAAQIEYDSLPKQSRPKDFESFWTKQGNAKYFRLLAKRHTPHRYAGKTTVIELSSGIFRQFLEMCSGIVDQALTDNWTPTSGKKIGSEKQNKAIREWSKDMYRHLGSSGDVSTLNRNGQIITSDHIIRLATSLSRFFQMRLLSDSKDPEVIAIALREAVDNSSFVKSLLDVAVRESVLQRRSVDYTSKSGGGERYPTYVLNRRLVPHVGIGTKLQGRHELSADDLELAANNTDLFLKRMNKGLSGNVDIPSLWGEQ